MQTKSIIASATMVAVVAAAPLEANAGPMPTLGGPNWYDWSAVSSPTSAVAIASSTASSSWAQWTPASVSPASTSSWAQWTPVSVSAASSSSWAQWSPVAAASTSAPYENPFTIYTTMTNQWGVITGMPSVVTSQPAVVTSQAWQPVVSVKSYANTTMVSKTSSSVEGFQQSKTATASIAVHTGAAASNSKISGAGLAVMVMGVAFSML